jgi:predicted short-subunit dehydrogenase-like oxidoreductase (DUF2520 family)
VVRGKQYNEEALNPNAHRPDALGIAGAGRVAQALGRRLHQQGETVSFIASRDPQHAQAAARFIGESVRTVDYADLPRKAARLIIAVPDGALAQVIRLLAESAAPGGVALHTSGARDLEDFAPLQQAGYSCGTFHPLQAIADREQGCAALRHATFAVSGEELAVRWARELVERLEGNAVTIPSGNRPLYHAAAVMAGNYSLALLDAASELMALATNVRQDEALRMIAPLARVALENGLARGPVAALTGPIERGDAGTVALHLTALETAPTRIRHLYTAAGLQTVDLARRRGLSEDSAKVLTTILYDQE